MEIMEPGGFYLSPSQVDRICAALERFGERMSEVFPKTNDKGPLATDLSKKRIHNMCS